MSDISDVERVLVSIIADSLGLGAGYLAGSLALCPTAGVRCRVYRGWPVSNRLDKDLSDSVANISVFPVSGATRHVPGHLFEWKTVKSSPTLTATVIGSTIALDGTGSPDHVVGVRFGPPMEIVAYAYRLVQGDGPSQVAEALANRIPGSSFSGATLTVPSNIDVAAAIGVDQPEFLETRRQEQQIMICGWCPTPASRDLIMPIVDAGFANMQDQWGRQTQEFGLPDGSNAILRYVSTLTNDTPQQANLWRRDLRYRVEFPTTLVELHPTAVFLGGRIYVQSADAEISFGIIAAGNSQDAQTLRAGASSIVAGLLSSGQSNNTLSATAAD